MEWGPERGRPRPLFPWRKAGACAWQGAWCRNEPGARSRALTGDGQGVQRAAEAEADDAQQRRDGGRERRRRRRPAGAARGLGAWRHEDGQQRRERAHGGGDAHAAGGEQQAAAVAVDDKQRCGAGVGWALGGRLGGLRDARRRQVGKFLMAGEGMAGSMRTAGGLGCNRGPSVKERRQLPLAASRRPSPAGRRLAPSGRPAPRAPRRRARGAAGGC